MAAALLVALLTACSSSPVETAEVAPPPPPEPITGRQALQSTFPLARGWAADAEPLRIRNFNLQEVPSVDGKAGAWEVTYASASMRSQRIYTWAALETQGLQKGAFQGQISGWTPGGRDIPFQISFLMIDTPDALITATEHAADYLKAEGEKPEVTFVLEQEPRFNGAVWRVMWGSTVGNAEYSVFVHPGTGEFLGR